MSEAGNTVSAEEIVDLIRQQNWKNGGCHIVDRDEAIALVEQYANVVASERAIETTRAAHDTALAALSNSEGGRS